MNISTVVLVAHPERKGNPETPQGGLESNSWGPDTLNPHGRDHSLSPESDLPDQWGIMGETGG